MLKNKTIITIIITIVLVGGTFFLYESHKLDVAHSTFENYYSFRGCRQLVNKTETYGNCKLADGSTIKLVLINSKWYLDGDGPGIW